KRRFWHRLIGASIAERYAHAFNHAGIGRAPEAEHGFVHIKARIRSSHCGGDQSLTPSDSWKRSAVDRGPERVRKGNGQVVETSIHSDDAVEDIIRHKGGRNACRLHVLLGEVTSELDQQLGKWTR